MVQLCKLMRAGHSHGPECVHTLSCLQQPIREMKSWQQCVVKYVLRLNMKPSRAGERAACAVTPSGDKWHCSTLQMLATAIPHALSLLFQCSSAVGYSWTKRSKLSSLRKINCRKQYTNAPQ